MHQFHLNSGCGRREGRACIGDSIGGTRVTNGPIRSGIALKSLSVDGWGVGAGAAAVDKKRYDAPRSRYEPSHSHPTRIRGSRARCPRVSLCRKVRSKCRCAIAFERGKPTRPQSQLCRHGMWDDGIRVRVDDRSCRAQVIPSASAYAQWMPHFDMRTDVARFEQVGLSQGVDATAMPHKGVLSFARRASQPLQERMGDAIHVEGALNFARQATRYSLPFGTWPSCSQIEIEKVIDGLDWSPLVSAFPETFVTSRDSN